MRHVSLCLAVFALACGTTEPEPEPLTIRVEGTITAADDGSPVVGAELTAFSPRLGESSVILAKDSTDTSGRYSLSFVNTECLADVAIIFIDHLDFFFDNLGAVVNCTTEEQQTFDVQLMRLP